MTTPYINPDMLPILERQRQAPAVSYETMPHEDGQSQFHALARRWNEHMPDIAGVRELQIPFQGRAIKATFFPSAAAGPGVIVALHGGGWTFGSVQSHERMYRLLSLDARSALLSVDYALAPGHPFPAGLNDALAAVSFVEGGGLGAPTPAHEIALAGDSAGANIALACLIERVRLGLPNLAAAALFYGCFEPTMASSSHQDFGDGRFGLSRARMQWYWRNYLGSEPETTTSLAAPLRANLRGLPPLHLIAAGLDVLRDETLELAARLAQADVPFTLANVPGVVHGFAQMSAELPAARDAILGAATQLRRHFKQA